MGAALFGPRAGTSPSYGSGGYPGDTELLTTFSWDDRNVRRVFIRKVRQGRAPHPNPGPSPPGLAELEPPALRGARLCWILAPRARLSLQVYAILMVQLLVTVVIVAFFTFW